MDTLFLTEVHGLHEGPLFLLRKRKFKKKKKKEKKKGNFKFPFHALHDRLVWGKQSWLQSQFSIF